jgi:hypothetical protein
VSPTHLSVSRHNLRIYKNYDGEESRFRVEESQLDTYYVDTYTVDMNITLAVDERLVARARKRAEALGKSLNQLIRDYLQNLADDDPERSIEEFKRLSGGGNSRGWRFNREELHERS